MSDLVRRLRAGLAAGADVAFGKTMVEGADCIEAQAARIERLDAQIVELKAEAKLWWDENFKKQTACEQMGARIAKLEAAVVPLDTPEGHKLKADADIPHLPTQLTYDCRNAISGHGPLAYTWEDKPHRLVYDLCREIERIAAITALVGDKDE